jgi:hypothetical protein
MFRDIVKVNDLIKRAKFVPHFVVGLGLYLMENIV